MTAMQDYLMGHFTKQASDETEVDSETLTKEALSEAFVKAANANGIDLADYSDDEVKVAFDQFCAEATEEKVAEDDDKDDDDKKGPPADLKEKAKEEHEEKKAQAEQVQAKLAEADLVGRQMARSFQDEMSKQAGAFERLKNFGGKAKDVAKDAVTGKSLREGMSERKALKTGLTIGDEGGHMARAADKQSKAKIVQGLKRSGGAAALATGAAAGGAKALSKGDDKGSKKKASAIDQLAAISAVEKLAAAGYDAEQAIERIGAAATLSEQSEKVASAADADTAVEVRSLELCEIAGYPVNWH